MAKHKEEKRSLTNAEKRELLTTLEARFAKNKKRHPGIEWKHVQERLENNPKALWSLNAMELSGGEPDVADFDKKTGAFTFFDCSPESPAGRRSLCYDHEALEARKEHKPENSAVQMAEAMGLTLMNEDQYRQLQELGHFDTKTSSWILTPSDIRKLGGAIFAEYRYGHVFIGHNGAQSYYAARGFRCAIRI